MRLGPLCIALAACALSTACNSVSKSDARPGGLVWTEDKAISWLSDISGNPAGHRDWSFVRVIAPPGATECRAHDDIFDGVNPFETAPVDATGAAMVTVRNEKARSTVSCRTPQGWVKRVIASEQIVNTFNDYKKRPYTRKYWAVPPMIHIDPKDPQAPARWDALRGQICPSNPASPPRLVTACSESSFNGMKARDLAG